MRPIQVRVHLSTEANHEEEIYFRCPKYPGQQREFKQWTPCQPLEAVPPAAGRKAQVLCRSAGGDGSGNLPALIHAWKGIQCLPDQGDLSLLQQGDSAGKESCYHGDGVSQQPIGDTASPFNSNANITSGRDDRTGGLPGLHGLPALAPNEGPFKPVTPKLERKLRAALKKAVAFWKQIQYS